MLFCNQIGWDQFKESCDLLPRNREMRNQFKKSSSQRPKCQKNTARNWAFKKEGKGDTRLLKTTFKIAVWWSFCSNIDSKSLNNTYLNMVEKLLGLFNWPNQDDWMNMTEIGEHDRKVDIDEH